MKPVFLQADINNPSIDMVFSPTDTDSPSIDIPFILPPLFSLEGTRELAYVYSSKYEETNAQGGEMTDLQICINLSTLVSPPVKQRGLE